MRAIIHCKTDIDNDSLFSLLNGISWWSALEQDDPIIEQKKKEILDHVADSDKALVEKTFVCTIYHEATKSWGIINRATKGTLTLRIKNPSADLLKIACENIVANLQIESEKKGTASETNWKISFSDFNKIEVRDKGGSIQVYFGEILPPQRWVKAVKDRHQEWIIGLCAGGIAFILFFFTTPIFFGQNLDEWPIYSKGIMERLASSALVTSTISFTNIILYWLKIRRKTTVEWHIE